MGLMSTKAPHSQALVASDFGRASFQIYPAPYITTQQTRPQSRDTMHINCVLLSVSQVANRSDLSNFLITSYRFLTGPDLGPTISRLEPVHGRDSQRWGSHKVCMWREAIASDPANRTTGIPVRPLQLVLCELGMESMYLTLRRDVL